MREIEIRLKLLTPLCTGDKNKNCRTLRETGILGSLRWWYEALIRGLGGSACDPTNSKCNEKNHCDACELFGCTGWARKFRLEAEKQYDIITLRFIELKKIENIEWALLNKTLQIIADYGALGGKLAEPKYGLIRIEENGLERYTLANYREELNKYFKRNGSNFENPNLLRFVFIRQHLNYEIVKDLKNKCPFLKGSSGKGKRYFYKILNKKQNRLFMYAENNYEYEQIVKFLKNKKVQFEEGKEVLNDI